ncbi:glycosyltransferase [Furfurilactobacillus curtus]|uniref:Poly(Glycerol-phosphate) alpha-glucosyltransferase n=1 Tax=Furfurilactobacillus curtus TaxID=1746200 RepID=A0ABQ5JM60_9LACO
MFYFVNNTVLVNNSGIEHAQFKRLILFKHFRQPAKIVTTDYKRFLHDNLQMAGVADDDVINMYDYYQQARAVPDRTVAYTDLLLPTYDDVQTDGGNRRCFYQGQLVADVSFWPKRPGSVSAVRYFDKFEYAIREDYYDVRGFLSMVVLNGAEGKTSTELMLTPTGEVALERHYQRNRAGNRSESAILLYSQTSDTGVRVFAGEKEFIAAFLDDLNQANEGETTGPNVFVIDRNLTADWAALHMKTRAFKLMHLHNAQVADTNDVDHSVLNNNYEFGLSNAAAWNGIIAATQLQRTDVLRRLQDQRAKVYRIPVGYVTIHEQHTASFDVQRAQAHRIIQVSRLVPEKHPAATLAAFIKVAKRDPQATLTFYGYGDDAVEQALRATIHEHHLDDRVKLNGYTNDIASVNAQATVAVLPTSVEGFGLSILESQAAGLPVITTNVRYGPAEIVQDQRSGYLLASHQEVDELADKLTTLLKSPTLWQRLHEGALAASQNFSEEAVWQCWQNVIKDAQQFYEEVVR